VDSKKSMMAQWHLHEWMLDDNDRGSDVIEIGREMLKGAADDGDGDRYEIRKCRVRLVLPPEKMKIGADQGVKAQQAHNERYNVEHFSMQSPQKNT